MLFTSWFNLLPVGLSLRTQVKVLCSLVTISIIPGNKWKIQGLQILLMNGVSVTSASQILESFWNIWSQVSQPKKPFSDFLVRGPGMHTLSQGIHEVAVAVH